MKFGKSTYRKNILLKSSSNIIRNSLSYNEIYPNENIFKTESDYKMKKDLSFHDVDEPHCKRILFFRCYELVKMIILISCLRNVYLFFTEYRAINLLLSLCRIPSLFVLLMNLLMVYNIDKFINHSHYLRMFLEIDNFLNILISAKQQAFLSFSFISMKLFLGFIYNSCFCLPMKESIAYYFLESCILIIFFPYSKEMTLLFLALGIIISFQYAITKSQREIWALFDSFKRSFINVKTIIDDFPFPLFIVRRSTLQIYYKNMESDRLYIRNKYLREGERLSFRDASRRNQAKPEFNFKDIFDKSVSKLLEEEIEKCLLNEINYFNFPFLIGEHPISYRSSNNCPTLFQGDMENVHWGKVYLFPCIWKGIDTLLIQILENNRVLKNNIFISDLHSKIRANFNDILDNINIICQQAPDLLDYPQFEAYHINSPGTPFKSCSKSSNFPKLNHVINCSQTANCQLEKYSMQKSPIICCPVPKFSPLTHCIRNTNNNTCMNYLNQLKEITIDSDLQNFAAPTIDNSMQTKEIETPFDYSTLFLLKNNLNYIYDLFLTIQVFASLRANKISHKLVRFHFEDFLKYMITYLYPIATIKKFKIDYKTDLSEEIIANYSYYRVIIFNTLMFIFNNSRGSIPKNLHIKVEHSSYSITYGSYYKIIFIFNNDDSIIDYEKKLASIFSKLETLDLIDVDFERLKLIDFGLIIAGFISNTIFRPENISPLSFSIISHKNLIEITTLIYTPEKNEVDHRSESDERRFLISEKFFRNYRKDSKFEDKYYHKIVERLYSIQTPYLSSGASQNHNKKNSNAIYDQGIFDEYLSEEEAVTTFANDVTLYRRLQFEMTKKLTLQWNRLISSLNTIEEVQRISSGIKFIQVDSSINKSGAYWDNSQMVNNMQYCFNPTFLIVEDNVLGKLSIIDELKKFKLKYLLDVASDGAEAVDKFRHLLNRGYLFDFIFMDIWLHAMSGLQATAIIRSIEKEYNVHTNIVCISVEGKNDIEPGLFDEFFEKPIKNCDRLSEYLSNHLKAIRPNMMHCKY